MSEQIQFLRRLRTVRDFRPDPVPEEALNDILEVGRWSGSANNRQPTEVVVVRDPAARQKLTDWGSNTAAKAPAVIVIITPGDKERFEHEVFDEGRIAERLQLAAAAHGLGSGVTWLKGDGPERAKELLGIPPDRRVRTVIALGYRDDAAIAAKPKNPQPRKEPGVFAHWDRY
jgi:nitroreductase